MVGPSDVSRHAGQVITVAAATGGHVAAVERFAVTGARAGKVSVGAVGTATAAWVRPTRSGGARMT